ncbi:GNAT family N-acetyltransferase [Agromyces laixinhei]|uniref:GNAT family N-acetyltransferase n=1 Tax=Agromyces laixinhei TaxID=2585717 RepID=UPI001116AA80|nr:GNAT family N-acetyltransferase [Agromyces laixinhei]
MSGVRQAPASAPSLTAVPVQSDHDAMRLISVLDRVWGGSVGSSHLDQGMVIALAHAGDYAVLFEHDGEAVGAGVGFFGPPLDAVLHSHIVGVVPEVLGRGVGLAIKQHQREWCLERGVRTMTWTFDPLVGRNAAFNLRKLGARAERYLENFYGEMVDGINSGQATDRVLLRWRLDRPSPVAGPMADAPGVPVVPWLVEDADGEPRRLTPGPDAARVSVHVPRDIEAMRRSDAALARRWRTAVRETLGAAMVGGGSVVEFSATGDYVVERIAG